MGIFSFVKNLYYNNRLERTYGFDEVAIKQKKNVCTSRLDADISSEVIRGIVRPVPLIASNMSTVVNSDMCNKLYDLGALGFMHRALPEEEYLQEINRIADKCRVVCASVGVGDSQFKLAKKLIKNGANVIVIDIAHGFSDAVVNIAKRIKSFSKNTKVVVGNTINVESAYEVDKYVDALKVGIAGGCFAAGTRILMSNGLYKNIENIVVDDIIINQYGKPARVKRSFSTGYKTILSVKSSLCNKSTLVTKDHLYFTENGWKEINEISSTLLFPKNIDFDMPKDFTLYIDKNKEEAVVVKPTYSSGYLFGSALSKNVRISKRTYRITWNIEKESMYIVKELIDSILMFFQNSIKIYIRTIGKYIAVSVYDKCLHKIIESFENKSLPQNLFVNNDLYLEGLVDSICDFARYGNSQNMSEIYGIAEYNLSGFLPGSVSKNEKYLQSVSFSKNCIAETVEVYDLEIDDNSHSFIANNAIVHNSACETAMMTGCTEKQFSVCLKFQKVSKKLGLPIISDGSIKFPADVVKAIGAGASSVMGGQIFARCPESAAEIVEIDGEKKKLYAGMASRYVQEKWRGGLNPGTCVEGKTVYLNMGEPVANLIERYSGALRSGLTYSGAKDISDFQKKCEFILIK